MIAKRHRGLPGLGLSGSPVGAEKLRMPSARKILHVDMDAFFTSVEEALDPTLKGKPLIVGGDPTGRGVVAAASYAVRHYGVHSAMPLARAKRLCPDAIFLRGSHRAYSEYSERVFAILREYSPSVEPMSMDEAFVDLTGCDRLHGPALETAERIRRDIRQIVGIPASIGFAANKLIAKIASGYVKPRGLLWIAPGKERRFLAPLRVERIPGIGPKGGAELRRMGIKTVDDLTTIPLEVLERAFGKWGASLYRKSRGVCENAVVGEAGVNRSIGRETTLETDTLDREFLESTLGYLVEKAGVAIAGVGALRPYGHFETALLGFPDRHPVARAWRGCL